MSEIGEKRHSDNTEQRVENKKSKIESRHEQKSTRTERKSQDKNYDMIVRAKKVWEKLRRGDISREEQTDLMNKMMEVIGGRVQEVIFKHDASRMIQTCLKKGNADQRNQIAGELKGRYLELSKSMYGKFIVMKTIEYCHKYRDQILMELKKNIRKLIRHKEASHVIETFYAQYANATQRHLLLSEFYGPEMTLFSQEGGSKTLEELLTSFPDKKDSVLRFMSETLAGCMDKGTISNSIVHKALYQYMTLADDKGREEMMNHLKEHLQDIVHTREGAWVAMICLSIGSPKDRKTIIKAFKPFLVKICSDEYGYLVLLRLLDVTDDIVLVTKAVLGELGKHAKELFADKFGRRFFLYILAGRNTRYLSTETVQLLKEGDKIRVSKKDPVVRAQEILKSTSPQLIKLVADNAPILMREKLSSQVVQEIMLHAVGDKTEAINAILNLAGESIEKENHIIEDRFANRIVKAMIKADSAEVENDKSIEPLEFAPKLLEVIKPNLGHFATTHGSYIVLALTEEPSTGDDTKAALKAHKKAIEAAAESNSGSKLILEALKKKK
ncbi:armadillo-type protein [Pilobolus umbonatus]|nr:armadillo-type protein [Pilobolus umbonatus]